MRGETAVGPPLQGAAADHQPAVRGEPEVGRHLSVLDQRLGVQAGQLRQLLLGQLVRHTGLHAHGQHAGRRRRQGRRRTR